jgi:hypothetical protein
VIPDDLLEVELGGEDGVVVLHPNGVLTAATYPIMRNALLKTVLAQPTAVVVDLSGLLVVPAAAASVFTAVWAQVAEWPGVPILLAADDGGQVRSLPSYETVSAALADVGEPPPRWVLRMPLPLSGAETFARLAAEETCRNWELRGLTTAAASVAAALAGLVTRGFPIRPAVSFEWWHDLLVVGVAEDAVVPCDPDELYRAITGTTWRMRRCGWSTTWSDGTLVWAVLNT